MVSERRLGGRTLSEIALLEDYDSNKDTDST